jgi:hypothetical protein
MRRIAVFFYGLFMDAGALRRRDIHPAHLRTARVHGFSLRIGQRATLVPDPEGEVFGVLMELTHDEIDRLYSEPSVRAYRPEAVICEFPDGAHVAALCFNLPEPPSPDERNVDYAEQLRDLARHLGLPARYVDGIA